MSQHTSRPPREKVGPMRPGACCRPRGRLSRCRIRRIGRPLVDSVTPSCCHTPRSAERPTPRQPRLPNSRRPCHTAAPRCPARTAETSLPAWARSCRVSGPVPSRAAGPVLSRAASEAVNPTRRAVYPTRLARALLSGQSRNGKSPDRSRASSRARPSGTTRCRSRDSTRRRSRSTESSGRF